MQIEDLILVLKIRVTSWEKDGDGYLTCYWDCPYGLGQDHEDTSARNVAATVNVTRCWPFKKYEWAVYAPFGNDDALFEGETADEIDAINAVQDALKKLIAGADGTG